MEVYLHPLSERENNEELLRALLVLEERCFSDPWSEGMIQSTLESSLVSLFTLSEGDVLVGYLMLMNVFTDGEILNIAVLPEYRRRGLADKLFDACCEHCRSLSMETLFLEVRESNAPAISLYQKRGFEQIGRRKNYYRQPKEDALVMRLSLETSL